MRCKFEENIQLVGIRWIVKSQSSDMGVLINLMLQKNNLLFLLLCLVADLASGGIKPNSLYRNFSPNWSTREGKFLSLFTVIQWNQGLCVAPSGEFGNCIPNNECIVRGGIPGGPCAGGYGICCIFMVSCGGVIRENGTYFVNPNHPETYDQTGSCQITILKVHPDICQIRLDFDQFSLASPEPVNHICNTDQFLVSGGSPAPTICGTSHGDHMYIDAGMGQSNPIILTVITSGPSFPRTWRIRTSQIACGSISRADQGCLQYFTGVSGSVRSFNFDPTNGRQLSNQDYSICIRTERNFCSIQYTASADTG